MKYSRHNAGTQRIDTQVHFIWLHTSQNAFRKKLKYDRTRSASGMQNNVEFYINMAENMYHFKQCVTKSGKLVISKIWKNYDRIPYIMKIRYSDLCIGRICLLVIVCFLFPRAYLCECMICVGP